MKFFDWLFRRKAKASRAARFDGSEAEQIQATKAAIDQVARGNGPAAGRFPKLSDGAPEVLTQTANSSVVAKEGPTPTMNIWEMEEEAAPPSPPPMPTPAREIAADAAIGARGRVRRPEESLRFQCCLQVAVEYTRLHDRVAIRGIDAQDTVHALEGHDDATLGRHGCPGRVRAAAARDQRYARGAAGADQRDDLFVRRREHDGVRHRLAARVVVAVDGARGRVGFERAGKGRAEAVEELTGHRSQFPLFPSPACGRG